MIEFPKRIDCGDFELVKPVATFNKAQEFFDIVKKNRDFLSQWLEWTDFYSKPASASGARKGVGVMQSVINLSSFIRCI